MFCSANDIFMFQLASFFYLGKTAHYAHVIKSIYTLFHLVARIFAESFLQHQLKFQNGCEKFTVKMEILLALSFINLIVLTKPQENCENCFNNESNIRQNYGVVSFGSLGYEIVKIAGNVDFEKSQCKEELLIVNEGVKKKEIWAFKS